MLQQTQVATVIPYYTRFLRAFPSMRSLAAAPLDRVLELWSGLGYYRRARNLHLAAQEIMRRFGGRFPRTYEQARSLPGVGEYTAHAILSIAANLPYAVLDGNVARVIARVCGIEGSINQPAFRRAIRQELESLLSRREPGNFNQAVMELGQTVCLPRAPRCSLCPVQRSCSARSGGSPESYPLPRPRRPTERRYLATAILTSSTAVRRSSRNNGGFQSNASERVAMLRGLDEGLLAQLWNFPSAFGSSRRDALSRLRERLNSITSGTVQWKDERFGNPVPRIDLHHGITHRSIHVNVYVAQISANLPEGPLRWFHPGELHRAAVSQLARKIAASWSGTGVDG